MQRSYFSRYGARPLRRFFQKQVENRLARAIISGDLKEGQSAAFDLDKKNDELKLDMVMSAEVVRD